MPVDLMIQGQGPIALALEVLLAAQGWDLPIRRTQRLPPATETLSNRAMALSAGSLQLLGRCLRALPDGADIHTVEVQVAGLGTWGGGTGRGMPGEVRRSGVHSVRMRAHDLGLERLGRVVFWGELTKALDEAPRPALPSPTLDAGEACWTVQVQADGDPGEDAVTGDSGQSALVAALRSDRFPRAWALERFLPEGPLALLPDPRPGHLQLVWCAPQAITQGRLDRMQHAPGEVLGELQRAVAPEVELRGWAGPATGVAIRRRARRRLVEHDQGRRASTVWIGNAAQILHPVAGQGLNLGLRDAAELARTLADLLASLRFRPEGATVCAALEAYAGRREPDRRALMALTDHLASATTGRLFQALAPLGLLAMKGCTPVRRGVAGLFAFGPAGLGRWAGCYDAA